MNEKGLTLDHGQDRRLPVSSQERGSCKSDNSPSTPGSPSTPCAITNAMESCLSRDDRRPATVVTARTTLRGCALSVVRRGWALPLPRYATLARKGTILNSSQ